MTIPTANKTTFSIAFLSLIIAAAGWYGGFTLCKIEVDDGASGILIALPTYNYCSFIWSYPQDDQPSPNHGNLTFSAQTTVSNQTHGYVVADTPPVFKKMAPCLKRFVRNVSSSPNHNQPLWITSII